MALPSLEWHEVAEAASVLRRTRTNVPTELPEDVVKALGRVMARFDFMKMVAYSGRLLKPMDYTLPYPATIWFVAKLMAKMHPRWQTMATWPDRFDADQKTDMELIITFLSDRPIPNGILDHQAIEIYGKAYWGFWNQYHGIDISLFE